MITEDYVSFETANLLKEKGFDEPCFRYAESKEIYESGKWTVADVTGGGVGVPTIQMAMKWLREKYNIHIEPRYFPTPNIYRYVIIHSPMTIENIDSHPQYFNTHEDACEAAIKYCLENLI